VLPVVWTPVLLPPPPTPELLPLAVLPVVWAPVLPLSPPPTPVVPPLAVLPVVWTPVLPLSPPPTPVVAVLVVETPVLGPVLMLSALSTLALPFALALSLELAMPFGLVLSLVLALPFAFALSLELALPFALALSLELALPFALALSLELAMPFALVLSLVLAPPFAFALSLELALPFAFELSLELALLFVLAPSLVLALDMTWAVGCWGSAAFGAGAAPPPFVLSFPSPPPLPPIWCSLEWLGSSLRWATAEALVWSCDLPCPCELSAARAGDVRASMRKRPAMRTKALITNRRASAGRLAKNSPNVSNAHLHVDMSDCLPPSWTWAPICTGICRRTPRSAFPSRAIP
jgi:hypothetical protein